MNWHVVRLTNPDYNKPISWKVLVQRAECFGAYPSCGFLRPGQTVKVWLYIRKFGFVIASTLEKVVSSEEVSFNFFMQYEGISLLLIPLADFSKGPIFVSGAF